MGSVIQCFLNVETSLKSRAIWFLPTLEKFKTSVNKSCFSSTDPMKIVWSKFREAPAALSKSRRNGERAKQAEGELKLSLQHHRLQGAKFRSWVKRSGAGIAWAQAESRASPSWREIKPEWVHFPGVETATFRIRVFLTLNPTRTT